MLIKNFEKINNDNNIYEDNIKKNSDLKKENEELLKIYNQKLKELNDNKKVK